MKRMSGSFVEDFLKDIFFATFGQSWRASCGRLSKFVPILTKFIPMPHDFRPSFWEQTTFLRPADVIVVGAGLTGLQAALELKKMSPKRDVLVVERAAVPRGASTRNAGFACFGGPTELLADEDAYGKEDCLSTVKQRYAGIRALEANFGGKGINWHQHGGYEIVDDPTTEALVRERLPALNALLREATGLRETWSIVPGHNGLFTLYNPLEAQLHPGKLVERLVRDGQAAGVRFLFGTQVLEVGKGRVETKSFGTLHGKEVLLTVNAFARELLPGDFPETIRPVRNQVLLSREIPGLPIKGCYHYHEGYVYFRNVGDNRLLIGGARHLAGETSETAAFGSNAVIARQLVKYLQDWYPELGLREEDFPWRWSGIIAQGDGKTPVLRRTEDGVLVAGRLAGMGVALSAALAARAAALLE